MSYTLQGVKFNTKPGYSYALESASEPGFPGEFGSEATFVVDKNGEAFTSDGGEYLLFARHPILDPEPIPYWFSVTDAGQVIVTNPNPTTPSDGGGDGVGSAETLLELSQEANVLGNMPAVKDQFSIIGEDLKLLNFFKSIGLYGSNTNKNHYIDPADFTQNGEFIRNINNDAFLTFFGRAPDGAAMIQVEGNNYIKVFRDGRVFFSGQDIDMPVGNVLTKTFAVNTAPLPSRDVRLVGVYEQNPVTGEYELKLQPIADFTDAQFAYQPISKYADKLNVTQTAIPGDARKVLEILCIDLPQQPDTIQYFTINPAKVGTPQAHNLQVAGNRIFPKLLDAANKDALQYMDIEFSNTAPWTYTITGPPDTTNFNGKLELRTIPA
ncbi:hypothetical protein IC229_33735 [Spirosoma sp. BT702]|uniref:Uncharacterized protein n=1 Tax=Spirosoma profusum TaxID=2771354 RepID=A0A927AWF7_9BACT|nr:hypothetical protein [Spirosoma profusum]MBD2705619.1 hypothetical protein [Spirosoma profusum]